MQSAAAAPSARSTTPPPTTFLEQPRRPSSIALYAVGILLNVGILIACPALKYKAVVVLTISLGVLLLDRFFFSRRVREAEISEQSGEMIVTKKEKFLNHLKANAVKSPGIIQVLEDSECKRLGITFDEVAPILAAAEVMKLRIKGELYPRESDYETFITRNGKEAIPYVKCRRQLGFLRDAFLLYVKQQGQNFDEECALFEKAGVIGLQAKIKEAQALPTK